MTVSVWCTFSLGVCSLYSQQRAIRVKRMVDRRKLWVLWISVLYLISLPCVPVNSNITVQVLWCTKFVSLTLCCVCLRAVSIVLDCSTAAQYPKERVVCHCWVSWMSPWGRRRRATTLRTHPTAPVQPWPTRVRTFPTRSMKWWGNEPCAPWNMCVLCVSQSALWVPLAKSLIFGFQNSCVLMVSRHTILRNVLLFIQKCSNFRGILKTYPLSTIQYSHCLIFSRVTLNVLIHVIAALHQLNAVLHVSLPMFVVISFSKRTCSYWSACMTCQMRCDRSSTKLSTLPSYRAFSQRRWWSRCVCLLRGVS